LVVAGKWCEFKGIMYRRTGHLGAYVSDSEANVSTQMTSPRGRNQNSDDANNHIYVRVTGELKS
jgi:hypothetical protein